MGVFFLRRRKADVLKDLPDKVDFKKEISMTPEQEEAYIREIVAFQKYDEDGAFMLELLHRLRRISDSSLLIENKIIGV